MRARRSLLAAAAAGLVGACAPAPATPAAAPPAEVVRAQVRAELPHDPTAFTQGLELRDGVLYEGTGLMGRSELRALDPATGAVRARTALAADLFGEGITVVGDRIWQLTWQNGVAIEYDRATLAERRRVPYRGEGWGLCLDETRGRLVMSDGTDRLAFRDPVTFEQRGEVLVRLGGEPVRLLNELECVDGLVYANVWQSDRIVRVDPGTGAVTGTADLPELLTPEERAGADVLNGIARVPGTDEFLVTGKLWPKAFRVRFKG